MRILLIMEEVSCGGAELSFFALCQALATRCDVHVALYEGSLDNPTIRALCDSLRSTSTTVHRCTIPLNPGTLANLHRSFRRPAARMLADLIRIVRPDAVVVNLPTVERGQAVADAVELCNPAPPLWGFLHLAHRPSVIGARLGIVRNFLVPRLIRRFGRMVTVSQAGAREISRRYGIGSPNVVRPPTAPLAALPIGADKCRLRRDQGLPDTFLLGIVGRIDIHHKGHDVALRVTERLLRQGNALQLVVVGDGPDREAVQRLAHRLGISLAVTFLGWRDDVGAVIPLLDALVMPSRYEGLPQSALQAVTAQVPVVGYAVDGLAELLPDAFAVPYGDEQGLGAAVESLMRQPHRWPGSELAIRAATSCEPGHVADQILALLDHSPVSGPSALPDMLVRETP